MTTVITMPTGLIFAPESSMGQNRYDTINMSPESGAIEARAASPARWTMGLRQPSSITRAEAGQWRAMVLSLSGRINVLAAYDPNRRYPAGTARGSASLVAPQGAGAVVATLGGLTPGATLLAGDLVQIGTGLGTSQLVELTQNATATGAGEAAIAFCEPIRPGLSFLAGATVTIEHPRAYFRRTSSATTWSTSSGGVMVTGLSIDLVEVWN
jgi:hypothetical protein